MRYTTVCQVIYAIVLPYIGDICELAMKFNSSVQTFWSMQRRNVAVNSHMILRKLKPPEKNEIPITLSVGCFFEASLVLPLISIL